MLRSTIVLSLLCATAAGAAAEDPPAASVKVAPVPAAPSARATPQPRICRTMAVTGSLISQRKQCLTEAQWRYVDDAHQTEARRLMMDNMGRPSCTDPATC